MAAAVISAIRDLGDMYKALQFHKMETQQKETSFERHRNGDVNKNYPISSSMLNIPSTSVVSSANHHKPLVYSNSVAVPLSSHSRQVNSNRDHRKLCRSMSEPVERSQEMRLTSKSRYKTELCRPFEESGTCKYGDKCQFAHGVNELRKLARHPKYKTELCRTFHTTGLCCYGSRCHFIHNDFNRSLALRLEACGIKVLNGAIEIGSIISTIPVKDTDICNLSVGSAGELSPNSSSVSGSPSSSSGFYMDEAMSPALLSAPPVMTNGAFFGRDFVPFSSVAPLMPQHQQPLHLFQPSPMSGDMSPQLDMINGQIDCLEIQNSPPGPMIDDNDNRGIRLPIFNQLAFSVPV